MKSETRPHQPGLKASKSNAQRQKAKKISIYFVVSLGGTTLKEMSFQTFLGFLKGSDLLELTQCIGGQTISLLRQLLKGRQKSRLLGMQNLVIEHKSRGKPALCQNPAYVFQPNWPTGQYQKT